VSLLIIGLMGDFIFNPRPAIINRFDRNAFDFHVKYALSLADASRSETSLK
jgi:hypothetical protein